MLTAEILDAVDQRIAAARTTAAESTRLEAWLNMPLSQFLWLALLGLCAWGLLWAARRAWSVMTWKPPHQR